MASDRANDLRAFRDFVDLELANGESGLSLDDALAQWEYENSSDEERAETIRAIRRGLEDMYNGRTVDAFEFARGVREELETRTKP